MALPLVIARNASLPAEKVGCQNCVNLELFPLVALQEKAICCPSRFRSEEDLEFIRDEVKKLSGAGVREKLQSHLGSGRFIEIR